MEKFENNAEPLMPEVKKPDKLSRDEVISRLESGESLKNLILTDINLAGLNFEGKSFSGSDIRGINLYNESQSEGTNIKNANCSASIRLFLSFPKFLLIRGK